MSIFKGRGKRNINMFFIGPPSSGKTVFWTMLGLSGTGPGNIKFYEPFDILSISRRGMPLPNVLAFGESQKILDAFKGKIISQNEWPDKTLLGEKHVINLKMGKFIIAKKINNGDVVYYMKILNGTFKIAPIDIPGEFVNNLDNAFEKKKVYNIDPSNIRKLHDSIKNVLTEMIKKPEIAHTTNGEIDNKTKDTSSESTKSESIMLAKTGGLRKGKRKLGQEISQASVSGVASIEKIGDAARHLRSMIENPPKALIITLRAKFTKSWDNATIGVTSRVIPRLLYAMTRRSRSPINVAVLLTAAVFDQFIEKSEVIRLVEDAIRLEEYQEILQEKFNEFRRRAGDLINYLVNPEIKKIRFIGLYPYDACIDLQPIIDPKTKNTVYKPKLTDDQKLRSFGLLTFIYNIMNVIQDFEPLIPPEIWQDFY